jgi:geranylgeranyl diphosphate synthase type I
MNDLPTQIRSVQEKIDAFLASYLKNKEQTILVTEITRMVKSGGKRIRPFILYSTYKLLGGKDEELVIKIGAAIELFHTFALIHDDIIDKSDLRRNTPTVRKDVGDSIAILVGDLSLAFANDIFYSVSLPASSDKRWLDMQEEVLTGEYLDSYQNIFQIIKQQNIDFEKLEKESEKIIDYKTARYTIVHPLLFATTLAQANKDVEQNLLEYGTKLGTAFQIKDDLLGIFGDEQTVGKPIDSDVKEGKVTLLMLRLLQKLPKQEWTEEKLSDIHFIREKMKSFEIDTFFEDIIMRLIKQADELVEKTTLGEKEKEFYRNFSQYIISRNK